MESIYGIFCLNKKNKVINNLQILIQLHHCVSALDQTRTACTKIEFENKSKINKSVHYLSEIA